MENDEKTRDEIMAEHYGQPMSREAREIYAAGAKIFLVLIGLFLLILFLR